MGRAGDWHEYRAHCHADHGDHASSTHAIHVTRRDEDIVAKALVSAGSGATAVHTSCALIDGERLLLCCGNLVFCLQLLMLELVWYTKADDAICFQIVQYHDDYLIHSEMAISRLDKNGHAVWQFSGKDIFVSAIRAISI